MRGGEGGRSKRKGMYVYLCLIHVAVRQKSAQHCKAIILRLKINFKNKIKHSMIQLVFFQSELLENQITAIPAGKGSVPRKTQQSSEKTGVFSEKAG